ncbi:MAG: DUF3368 domain-containing protein [Candidatus Bathyarchaeia archaeon]
MIVSNASPLIVLLKVSKLSILKELFKRVLLPTAVYEEITAKEYEKSIFNKLEWIKVTSVKNLEIAAFLEKLVDKGEAEAIMLAKELKTTLLMDDAKARKYAKLLSVEVIGTLGVLKMAKNHGLISSVKNVIKDLLDEGYYIEDELIKTILQDAGEL